MTPNLLHIQISSESLSEILKAKASSKYKLLCILNFYDLIKVYPDQNSLYSFYHQFINEFSALIEKEKFNCWNPDDIQSLSDFLSYLKTVWNLDSENLAKLEGKLSSQKNKILSFLSENNNQNNNTYPAFTNSVNISLIEQSFSSGNIRCGAVEKMKIDEIVISEESNVKFNNQTNVESELLKQLNQSVQIAKKDITGNNHYKFAFEFEDNELMYDGSSLGCGAACLAYNSILRSGLNDFHYRFRDDAVMTGAVDNRGKLIPLSEESLKVKLETVFYSGYKTFVIPKDNFNYCFSILNELNKEFPDRKLLLVPADNYKEVLENTNVTTRYYLKLREKVNSYYKKYQKAVNAAAMVVIITGVIYAALGVILPKLDKNPVTAEYFDNRYILKNKYSEPVWESGKIGNGRDWIAKSPGVTYNNNIFLDIDNNEAKELLYIKSSENQHTSDNTIYISSGDSDKVFYSIPITNLYNRRGDTLLSTMNIIYLNILDSARFGNGRIIFNAKHLKFFPAVIGVLDSFGNLISQFWNYGHLYLYFKDDFDKDGKLEYYYGGSNNKDGCAAFTVFDPEFIDGAAPEYDITGNNKTGTEKYYINIPGSKLMESSDNIRNKVVEIRRSSDTSIFVSTSEMVYKDSSGTQVQPYLMYSFDRDMNCLGVTGDDYFYKIYNRMQKENPVLEQVSDYYNTLRKQVMWWNGEKFVNERAINKEYLKRVEQKQINLQ